MADEPIGSVNVSIGGDYSQLQADFEETVKQAQTAGKDVAEAFTSAADGEQALEQAFQRLVDAGYTVEEAMQQFQGMLEQVQAAEAATVASTDAAAEAARNAGEEFAEFGGAADRAARDAVLFSESAQGIVDSQREAEAELTRAQTALEEIRLAYSLGEASANDLARAESAVKQAFEEANPALVTAREEAARTAEDTATLAEKLTALAEALAVTALLKEFGEQAIELASEQEVLVISLEALTGSAEEAQKQLEQIDAFSFSNALDIDAVEAATQKMTAFGFSTEETSKLLQSAADSAAATGKSFDSTAEKIGNMALSGSAGARQLTTLGLSLDDLAKQLGVTSDKAAKAFKELDQSERINILTGALDKFQGTAAAVADSTAGRFQNLKNDIHNLFETIGGELLPVVNQMLGVLRDDVLPVVKSVTEWFTNLPAPVKTLAVDAALLAAALVPLTAGIAGVSLAIDGLKTILPITAGLLQSFGATSAAVAIEEDIAAASTLALGGAASTAGTEIAAAEVATGVLASTLGGILVGGVAAAVISLIDLKNRLDAAHASMKGISESAFNEWLSTGIGHLKNAAIGTEDLERLQKNLNLGLELGAINAGDYARYLAVVEDKLKAVNDEDLSETLAAAGKGIHIVSEEAGKAHDELSVLQEVLEQAKKQLDGLSASYESGKTTAQEYQKAQKAVTDAQDKLNDATADAAAKAKLSTVAYNEWAASTDKALLSLTPYLDSIKDLASAHDILAAGEDVAAEKLALLEVQFREAGEKLFVLNERVKDAARALDGTAEATDRWHKAMRDAVNGADDLKKKTDSLVAAQVEAAKQVGHVSAAIEDLRTSQEMARESQTAWANTADLLTEKLNEQQQRLVQLNELARAAKVADDGSTESHLLWVKAVEAATKASDDLIRTQGELAKAHDRAKDATSDLSTISVGYGIKLTQTVTPASKELASQTNDTTVAFQDNTVAAKSDATALDDVAESARAAGVEVGSLSEDLKRLTEDFLGLGEAKSKGVSFGNAPDGYYWRSIGSAATGFKVDLAPIPEGFEIGPMGTPIPIPGYDWEKKQDAPSSNGGEYGPSSSSGEISGPVDIAAAGGSYPGVVIHQAAGEVLLVALATASQIQGAAVANPQLESVAAAASAAEAASVTAMAVATSSDTIRLVVNDLNVLTQVVQQTVNQTVQIASRLSMVAITNPGSNSLIAANDPNSAYYHQQPSSTPSKLAAGPTTTVYNTPYSTSGTSLYPGLPTGPTGPPVDFDYNARPSTPSPAAPAAAAVNVNVDMRDSTFGSNMSPTEVGNQVKQAVAEGLTRVLRDAGARY